MKILIICPSLPYPANSGGSIRIFNLIKRLAKRNEVELMTINNDFTTKGDINELKKYCQNVYLVSPKKRSKTSQLPRVLGRLIKGEPLLVMYAESNELGKLLHELSGKENYDIIHFEHSATANNIKFLHPQHHAKTVLSMHDINFMKHYRIYKNERKIFKRIKHFLTWFPMLSWEPKVARSFDKSIVVSDVDKTLLKSLDPGLNVSVVPNGVDTKAYRPYPLQGRKKDILMVGTMDHKPNVDAAKYFYNEIFPHIRAKVEEVTLTVVGKNPPSEIQQLDSDSAVEIRPNVPDVRPYYKKAMVSAVPLRSGGGTRLKILESMALGTPVVSTSVGCEGLEVKNKHNILIANNPVDFANKVIGLLTSATLWTEISQNGRDLVEKKYDWRRLAMVLERVYDEALSPS